jgi:hypothetical protein
MNRSDMMGHSILAAGFSVIVVHYTAACTDFSEVKQYDLFFTGASNY